MLTQQLSNELADAAAAAAPSIVQVSGGKRPASGIVFGVGTVLTAVSVIPHEEALQVRGHDGRSFDASLVGWDPATGLAVMRAADLDAPPLAPSTSPVRVGHLGLAIARSWSNALTASAGIVAVIGGPLRTGRRRRIEQVFRTTAPMHEGFAGGAFLDASGGLTGVTTAASIRGLGVVIPAAIAWNAAAHVLEHGRTKRGYLGMAGQPVALPAHQRGPDGRERALLTLAVTSDGPAARAGLLVGDVVLAIDATPVESQEDVIDLLTEKGVGHEATLRVLRGAAPLELAVTIGERPAR